MRIGCWMMAVLGLATLPVFAQVAPAPAATTAKDLPAVVVSGELPGPGLWKVSKGDHVLWILGTLAPLPKKMQWQSRQVGDTELEAQAVLLPPGIEVNAKVGFFGSLLLLPRLVGIRNNPDGRKLVDVLPPPVYARWLGLKARYLGHDGGVEKYRPMFAAIKLYEAAVKEAGLSDDDIAGKLVRKLAKAHDIPLVDTSYKFTLADPKAALTEFRHGGMDDTACFEQTLDRVEHGVPQMQAQANAWATGDIDALARMPRDHADRSCADAFDGADFARQQGLQDLPEKVAQSWMDAAGKALAQHGSSLALLPMEDLLAADGYLARLKAQGYTVESPDEQD
ncbi:TraB/GumN family protein [Rhodanobacter sp. DHB23]|uniref:TraB/GumN family protein n=1 Tax=Rhodanobacter sp. DHB23 TaxID=2775923 RepID=UPI0017871EF6|nr:TraB/GumN family protein [Rhodanobacter sp. DHB23]MBD8872705.1 TraB/GumN family protein [Rhodanobacter sp. DHB23]